MSKCMHPSVSVIIPAYRAARTIRRALESVLSQTAPPAQVIVIDDGSPDDLARAVSLYGDRVTLLSKPNGGAASARNAGIDVASGDFIAFLDADDYWEPKKLERQLAVFERHPELGLVAGQYFVQQPGGVKRRAGLRSGPERFDCVQRARGAAAFRAAAEVWTGTVLVRREALGDEGFVSGLEPAEDRDLWV
ncbi:MAG TPA: glycosyltransferase family A protein, partial [Pirellulales bacterium]|nr:glycosyltransferase family A protein [Pirellulales bacterium]